MPAPKKPQISTSVAQSTLEQIQWLKKKTGMTMTTILSIAIRNLYNAERRKEEG